MALIPSVKQALVMHSIFKKIQGNAGFHVPIMHQLLNIKPYY